jgi:hypothetical protein
LQNFVVKKKESWQFIHGTLFGNAFQVLTNFASHPQLELIHLVVRLVYEDDEFSVEPISILRPDQKATPVFQLAFDSFGAEQNRGPVSVSTSNDAPDLEDIESSEDELTLVSEDFVPSRVALGRWCTSQLALRFCWSLLLERI